MDFKVSATCTPTGNLTPRENQAIPINVKDYYQPGGFHRVHLGDTYIKGQYTILRKLGYGHYSSFHSVNKPTPGHMKYVALKILRSDCYSDSDSSKNIFESEIFSKISDIFGQSPHQGSHHVSHRLDQFTHTGPNGNHFCFAFDVLGHHLNFQTVKFKDERLPVRTVKVITRQLLLALDFLYREVGLIHTDLKPTNILLEPEDPERTIKEIPIQQMKYIHIRLIDFGVGITLENPPPLIQPPALRAPEVTIGVPWDTGMDTWSPGCIIVELVQGFVLFSGEASQRGTWTAEDDRLARIKEVLGTLHRIPYLKPTSLERLLNGKTRTFLRPAVMTEAEMFVFIDSVRGMLEVDPRSKKSAAELWRHEWLRL
ncbi:kinase-like domain-containing protein [Aspergillus venezuelensis]